MQPGDELGKHDGLTPDPALWHAILARLDVALADRDVWLAPTMLAHSDDLLVLACPHKLVGEAIHTRYRAQTDAAISALLGRPAQVEITVKYMPDVTAIQRSAWLDVMEQQPYPAWLRDDDQLAPPTYAGCDDQQRANRSEVATPHEEAFTSPLHMHVDQDAAAVPALPHAHQEITKDTCASPPTPSTRELWTTVFSAVAIPLDERRI